MPDAETNSPPPALPSARDGSSAREVAHRCAAVAAETVHAALARPRVTVAKGETAGGRSDIVTSTDPLIEREVTAILAAAYPDHAVLGEETGAHPAETSWTWVIDPIDGTRNFSTGIPLVAFNLALYHRGEPRLGLTLDPLRDELFYAERGAGATLNGEPLRVGEAPRLADGVLCLDLGLDDRRAKALLLTLHHLFPGVQAMRLIGTTALAMAYLAAGRIDAYVHPSPYAWDFAPGALLVAEAGGVATDFDGGPLTLASRSVLASNPAMHAELVARFRAVVS